VTLRMGVGRRLFSSCGAQWLRWRGVCCGPGLTLYGLPLVSRAPGSAIELGRRVALCSTSRWNPVGVCHPVILRTLNAGAHIAIGDDSGLSGVSICAACSVRIGAECLLGANVVVTDSDFHPVAPTGRRQSSAAAAGAAPVVIEDNVWLGMNVIVLKGVRIGRNSVVGAGSIVTRDIPADCIAAGNPARVVRQLTVTAD
jgi:acetyltransferase-like isoleucine patch superfamily enzyme